MTNVSPLSWRADARMAARVWLPFCIFALAGFYPAEHGGHGGLPFMLLYATVLLPGTLLFWLLRPAGGAAPWPLALGSILVGQYLFIYLLVRIRSWLRTLAHARSARDLSRR